MGRNNLNITSNDSEDDQIDPIENIMALIVFIFFGMLTFGIGPFICYIQAIERRKSAELDISNKLKLYLVLSLAGFVLSPWIIAGLVYLYRLIAV